MIEIIILSIIQGVTEFLPISSSAHLILVSKYFNFSNENLTLDVSLHLGSVLAIIFYLRLNTSSREISNSIPLLYSNYDRCNHGNIIPPSAFNLPLL